MRLRRPSSSLNLLLLMLPIKSVAFSCRKGGALMKLALFGGLIFLWYIVGVPRTNPKANINPNVYPGNISERYGATAPWEWHAGPGPNKRGNMCLTHVDLN